MIGFFISLIGLSLILCALAISGLYQKQEANRKKFASELNSIRLTQETCCHDIEYAVNSAQEVIKLVKDLREKLITPRNETLN